MQYQPRYNTLDPWRGIACLMVIVYHSTFYATGHHWLVSLTHWGWVGVPMFFVISGYCISATAESNHKHGRTVANYFTRRFRRIFPPYLICLFLSVVFAGSLELVWPGLLASHPTFVVRPWWMNPLQIAGNLTLTEGWIHHLVGGEQLWFLNQSWTLGFEEQFYAVTGVILLIAPSRFFLATALVSLCVFLLMPLANIEGVFFNGLWLHFAAGVFVYYACVHGSRWSMILLSAVLFAGITHAATFSINHGHACMLAYSFALILIALRRHDERIMEWRAIRPLTYCGTMCYSLYLVHWPLVKAISHGLWNAGVRSDLATCLLTVPLCLIASVVIGHVFHQKVERRFLNAPQKSSQFLNHPVQNPERVIS